MDYTVSITDATLLVAMQRALAARNAGVVQPLTEAQFVQQLVDDHCRLWANQYVTSKLAQVDFMRRFTKDERVAIRTAAESNHAIADYLGLLSAAPTVDLTDPETVADVQQLETSGLIAAGRAAQILAL